MVFKIEPCNVLLLIRNGVDDNLAGPVERTEV